MKLDNIPLDRQQALIQKIAQLFDTTSADVRENFERYAQKVNPKIIQKYLK